VPPSVLSRDPLSRDPLTRHPGTGHPGTGHPGTGAPRAKDPGATAVPDAPGPGQARPGRLLVLYGRLLGLLLVGYLLFDKGFAYLHLPGTPLYVGELVLLVGTLGVLTATGYLRVVIRDEPVLALLAGFFLWGLVRLLPGLRAYGILAVRDFALVYYCLFALFIAAALARSPGILRRWIAGFDRLLPWLLAWLPPATILGSLLSVGPHVPFSSVPALTHAAGSAAVAAFLALGFLWLFPGTRSLRSRVAWSVLALAVIVLSATQNRGGLLGVAAGAVVGLAFFRGPLRLIKRSLVPVVLFLTLATLLPFRVPIAGWQARSFSVSQLVKNVVSITGTQHGGNLNSNAAGREHLWSAVYQKQVADGTLVYGSGFGVNLATQVGVYQASVSQPGNPLRSPHNSHLDVLARMGLVGLALWGALWLGWYWRMVAGCRRLLRRGLRARRHVAVLCMMATTAILVSSFFAPELEGAQVAALLWTAFGVGVAVTSFRACFSGGDIPCAGPDPPAGPAAEAAGPRR
jgi:O-antigen ligase